jgi:hypothetical protein
MLFHATSKLSQISQCPILCPAACKRVVVLESRLLWSDWALPGRHDHHITYETTFVTRKLLFVPLSAVTRSRVEMPPAGKRVVVLESRLLGSGQTGRSLGDMTSWHTGLFSSLERWTSRDQRQQVRSLWSVCDVVRGRCLTVSRALLHVFWGLRMVCMLGGAAASVT